MECLYQNLIRCSIAYGSYRDFLDRGSLNKKATETRIPSGYVEVITSNIYSHLHDLVNSYRTSVSQMTTYMFVVCNLVRLSSLS